MTQKDLFDDNITITLTDDDMGGIDLSSTGATNTMLTHQTYTYNNISTYPGITVSVNGTGGGGGSGGYLQTGYSTITNTNHTGVLAVKGDAEFDGDISIKGKKLSERLDKIEDKLAIYYPNEELEAKWEELRDLSRKYKELEKEIMDKEKMWNILKK